MNLGDLFSQWQSAGIFAYALPFLLIFAILFGILSKINIFGSKENPNKGVNVIISMAVAFMALQFNIVSNFFARIFPNLGVALSIILVILLMLGLFFDLENKNVKWVLYAVILVVIIAVLWGPLGSLGINLKMNGVWSWITNNFGLIFFLILFFAVIIWAVAGGKKKSPGEGSRAPAN